MNESLTALEPFLTSLCMYVYLFKGFKTDPGGPAVSQSHMQMMQSWAASFVLVL